MQGRWQRMKGWICGGLDPQALESAFLQGSGVTSGEKGRPNFTDPGVACSDGGPPKRTVLVETDKAILSYLEGKKLNQLWEDSLR